MRLICRVSAEIIDVELVEAPVKTWREGGCRVVLTDHANGAEHGGAWDEPEPGGDGVGVGLFGDGKGVCSMVVIVIGCPSERDAVEGADDTVLWRNRVKGLNKGELFGG